MNKDINIINYDKSELPENASRLRKAWHWITNAQIKSTEEILIKDMHEASKISDKIKLTDANGVPKTFKTLLKELPKDVPEELTKTLGNTRKKISMANKAQVAGYLYSMLALGIGIPVLNIYMTKYFTGKKNDKQADKALPTGNDKLKLGNSEIGQYFMKPEMIEKIKKANACVPVK